ncbi:MAG: class I SAM-dependent methyltransferase [Litorilinea sp.]
MGVLDLLTNLASLGVGVAAGSQAAVRAAQHRRPRPMPRQMAKLLDHPLRMRYRNPGATLGLFGLGAGMQVVDLGCGSGTFTVEMARMVGAQGMVHAVDLQQPVLEMAQARVVDAGFGAQVRFHNVGAYQLPLDDDSIDVAVLIATLGEIPDKLLALLELRRVLKPGGRLAISEELPDPGYLPAGLARALIIEAGFAFGGHSGSPFCYSMIFSKPHVDSSLIERV